MARLKLHHWILIAMALGAVVGLPLNWAATTGKLDPALVATIATIGKELGGVFLRLLQMLVVPLIMSSLVTGVTGMGNLSQLGRLGGRTLAFYLGTSFLAILTGLAAVNVFKPGVGADLDLLQRGIDPGLPEVVEQESVLGILWKQITGMIPSNPIRAASEGDMLPIIFFSLLLGIFISAVEHGTSPEASGPEASGPEASGKASGNPGAFLRKVFESLFEVMMRMTLWVISLAPFGVFGFMLHAAAGSGFDAFRALGLYALTVAVALAFHALVTLPLLLRVLSGRSPIDHAKAMTPALLTAFSTASSNGTLPLTMQCVEERAGVPQRVSSFVLPLGATINMDGTALYEAVAVLFIAQVYGMDLSFGQQAVVAFTALLASVGAAGCVPICSNLRMSSSSTSSAACSGQTSGMRSLRTYRRPVPCGAASHLCRLDA